MFLQFDWYLSAHIFFLLQMTTQATSLKENSASNPLLQGKEKDASV